MNIRPLVSTIWAGVMTASLLSCDSIYDDPADFPLPQPSIEQTYQYIDCTKYTNWVYINLHTKDSATFNYNVSPIPIDWDIALHRYDVKTNGGQGLETNYTNLDDLKSDIQKGILQKPDESRWVSDVDDSVTVDMTHMMEGYLVYAHSSRNLELCKWLDVNLSSMPPIYTPSNKVYLLKLADNTVAAIRFTAFADPARGNAKGYISFDYIYPLNFTR